MSDFGTGAADGIRKNLTDLIGALFENTISPEYIGLPQYEDALKRLAEIGKQAEEYLEKYRAWKDGAQEPEEDAPRVMPTETSPGEMLEELAPLFTYGGMEAKIIVDQYQITNHIFDTQSSCILTIRWRETGDAEKAKEIYQTISKMPGISRFDWEFNQH